MFDDSRTHKNPDKALRDLDKKLTTAKRTLNTQ